MLFSIIVPVFKVEKYLNRCVDSIIAQSFRDFELILIDDGSPDRCGELCDAYAARDQRVKVIHQDNGGVSVARNAGLDNMKGEYALFVDSDDWVETEWLEEIHEKLVERPADVVVWGCNIIYQDRVEKRLLDSGVTLEQAKANFLADGWQGYAFNRCWKRDLFVGVRFPKEVIMAEDLWVTGSLMVKAKSLSFIDKCLYNYWKLNSESCKASLNSIKLYWLTITRLRNNQLLKQEGLPHLDISNIRVLRAAIDALIVNKEDKLLTSEQADKLGAILANYKPTIQQAALSLDKYKVYKGLARYASLQGHYGQALTYCLRYAISKPRYKVYHILFRHAKGKAVYGRALTYAWYHVLDKAKYLLGK